MEKIKPYAKTIDPKVKRKIWYLYFDLFYSYEDIMREFKWKYNFSQLKSIIMSRYDEDGKGK